MDFSHVKLFQVSLSYSDFSSKKYQALLVSLRSLTFVRDNRLWIVITAEAQSELQSVISNHVFRSEKSLSVRHIANFNDM